VGDLWQFIIDCSFKKWVDDEWTRDEFLKSLSDYERLAVQFGTLNCNMQDGGFAKWVYYGFDDDDIDDLEKFIENCDYPRKDIFVQMFENYRWIKESIEKLDEFDDFYQDDLETREKYYSLYDKKYFMINLDWENYFSKYLIDNIQNEYIEKIKEYNKDIKI